MTNDKSSLIRQHTFNNNLHNSLNPNDLKNGYSIANNAKNANSGPTNIGESNKTGTFNKKFSAAEIDVEDSVMDKSKNEEAVNKSHVIYFNLNLRFLIL